MMWDQGSMNEEILRTHVFLPANHFRNSPEPVFSSTLHHYKKYIGRCQALFWRKNGNIIHRGQYKIKFMFSSNDFRVICYKISYLYATLSIKSSRQEFWNNRSRSSGDILSEKTFGICIQNVLIFPSIELVSKP